MTKIADHMKIIWQYAKAEVRYVLWQTFSVEAEPVKALL